MARVVLAMSGGVDSSVAASLLQQQGHEVFGVFMRHGEEAAEVCSVDGDAKNSPLLPILQGRADHKQGCCSASDAEDGRRVAQRLGIPFYALNLEREFGDIIEYFVDEYTLGRTPNPCVMCNNHLKFGKLFDYADDIGAEFVATGHYARLDSDSTSTPALLKGIDSSKDQSYVLFGIPATRFKRMLLPVGGFQKSEIREMAAGLGLNVAEKKDSQEICFVTSGKHDEFVKQRRPQDDRSGDFVLLDGTVVGQHAGIERFTIGQRKGLGIALGDPHFVVSIEPDTRRVVLGPKAALGQTALVAERANWLHPDIADAFKNRTAGATWSCDVKIRYNTPPVPGTLGVLADGRMSVEFEEPCLGVAPGQAVVCYDGDRVLGGGWIQAAGDLATLSELSPSPLDAPVSRLS